MYTSLVAFFLLTCTLIFRQWYRVDNATVVQIIPLLIWYIDRWRLNTFSDLKNWVMALRLHCWWTTMMDIPIFAHMTWHVMTWHVISHTLHQPWSPRLYHWLLSKQRGSLYFVINHMTRFMSNYLLTNIFTLVFSLILLSAWVITLSQNKTIRSYLSSSNAILLYTQYNTCLHN